MRTSNRVSSHIPALFVLVALEDRLTSIRLKSTGLTESYLTTEKGTDETVRVTE